MNWLSASGRAACCILGLAVWLAGPGEGGPVGATDSVSPRTDDVSPRTDDAAVRVEELIEQLGADDFATRERAQAELARLGLEAFDALYQARLHEDIEIAMRARFLVHSIPIRWTQEHDPIEVRRILRHYDQQDPAERVSRMQRLALLEDAQGTDALCRLVRFETSSLLSKRAGLLVLQQPLPEVGPRRAALAASIRASVGASQRPAADWLRAFGDFLTDPQQAVARWDELIHIEQDVFRQSPDITSYEILRDLMRWHVEMLVQLGREPEATERMIRIAELRNGVAEDLVELVDWLLARSAWPAIDQVADRFADKFQQEARLAYRLAESHRHKGKTTLPNRRPNEPCKHPPRTATSWPAN